MAKRLGVRIHADDCNAILIATEKKYPASAAKWAARNQATRDGAARHAWPSTDRKRQMVRASVEPAEEHRTEGYRHGPLRFSERKMKRIVRLGISSGTLKGQ